VLAICGCGGGGDRPGNGYLREGDALCTSINKTIALVAHPTNDPSEHARQDRAVLAAAERARARFGRLDPPAAKRALAARFLSAFDAKLDAVRRMAATTERRDRNGFRRAVAANHSADVRFNDLAQRIGFSVCGYPAAPPGAQPAPGEPQP
jgi:hypothetical protein